jgi:hypothetical protein
VERHLSDGFTTLLVRHRLDLTAEACPSHRVRVSNVDREQALTSGFRLR